MVVGDPSTESDGPQWAGVAEALAVFWKGGSGPSHASLTDAFASAGYVEPKHKGTKAGRVRRAVLYSPDVTRRRLIDDLLGLLRDGGFLDPGDAKLTRAKVAFQEVGLPSLVDPATGAPEPPNSGTWSDRRSGKLRRVQGLPLDRPEQRDSAGSEENPADGWWRGLSRGTKGVMATLAGGVLVAVATGPLAPILQDVGSTINPFAEAAHAPTVTVVHSAVDFGRGWVVPKPLEEIGELPVLTDSGGVDFGAWSAWALQEGAVRAGSMTLGLSVQGGSAKAVLITHLDITITARRPPLAGTHVFERPVAGGVTPRRFTIDLDGRPAPVVQPYIPTGDDDDATDPGIPVDFPYWVSETELEYLRLDVYTAECDCQWIGTLHWIVNGTSGQTAITDDGGPFRVTATASVDDEAMFDIDDSAPYLRRM